MHLKLAVVSSDSRFVQSKLKWLLLQGLETCESIMLFNLKLGHRQMYEKMKNTSRVSNRTFGYLLNSTSANRIHLSRKCHPFKSEIDAIQKSL